ncbi:MAG TPA: chromosome segregation protein SMC [Rubrivivax sp.]|nr:chromosome segregation protein SMC [Rubrivivax sp.]
MRLNQIKLSGFKSFSDPTTFALPGQRVGVVGPNGCGKSNIMDAVRWVLGESKASELRGESMQDVIFNGSGLRKPAGRASVELVFENHDARAGGPWNQYAEIAVRRVLTRDGGSSYYINNQPVRRRDVQDVFMGTGLGPRAYAIIGQGTISRIIESRPEELRLFLEEAAGVSKYKERRRETENRLKDTRENLTRVDDILRELNANLDKLEKQAEVATQYRQLQDLGTLKLHQFWFLKHRDAANEEQRAHAALIEATTALEARVAELRRVEAEMEALRQAHYAAADSLHQRQGDLAEAALEVSRLEERIRYVVEGRERAQARLDELRAQDEQWAARQRENQAELEQIALGQQTAEAQSQLQAAQAEEQALQMPGLEDALRDAQQRSQQQRAAVAEVQQQIQVLAAESRSLDDQTRQLQQRSERLGSERQGLAEPDLQRLAELKDSSAALDEGQAVAEARLHELGEQLQTLDEQRRAMAQAAAGDASRQAELGARLEALRALQDKVQSSGKLKPWLIKHGLDSLEGLWTQVHIEPGWETALEAALRERLNALQVGRLDQVRAFAADAPPTRLAFYSAHAGAMAHAAASAQRALPRLSDLLRLNDAGLQALLNDWLEGVYTAPSLDEALAARGQLTHGEVVMSREGHAVSLHAVSFYAPDTEQAGMLARQQEIENLERQHRAQCLIADESRIASVRVEAAHTEASLRLITARREAAEAQTRAHQTQVELLRLGQQAEASQARRSQLDGELAEATALLDELQQRRNVGEARFEALDQQLADAQQRHSDLDDAVIAAERQLNGAREQLRALERQAQEAAFQARTLVARQAELQRAIGTAQQQVATNLTAAAQIEEELAGLNDAAATAGLQTALALRLQREQVLAAARSGYDELSAGLRAAEEQRLSLERSLEPMREGLTRLQLEQQAGMLGGAQYMEQLAAAQVDLQVLAQGIEHDSVKLWGLQGEIDRLNRELAALGAVNLAALEELTASRERKTFLDAQNADLQEAMSTLEDAIRKIDLETRELLGQTFTQVNEHFGRMFPSLFGGGSARLAMTGDEILDAGVQVMAQPPGKKNSTIHLMSGGEKALTAIALVFAIFQLNPAPFCLLDEVDAPLDDANTERYCKLVTEMSQGTQFLFISHNKIAMEMAEQLIGVTMQEQGVSRIVAVDMDAAVGMAEAA